MVDEAEKLQEEVDKLQDDMEALEEKCDTLDLCQEDDGCSKCEQYSKMEQINAKIAELEEKIEDLMGAEDEIQEV